MSAADELENILKFLTQRVIRYVREVESPNGSVGQQTAPKQLAANLIASGDPIQEKGQGHAGLENSIEWLLENSVATWHKSFLEKLYAGTNPVGVASDILLSVLNTNSHVFTASPAFTVIERHVSHKYAQMFGFNGPRSGGLTFPGGSYSNITSMQMARSLMFPETKEEGNRGKELVVFSSDHSHYSVMKAAILLGLGKSAVIKVNVRENGSMDVLDLEAKIERAKKEGKTPFYVNATAGSTVYGSFDPFEDIADLTETHGLWLHVDASWGGNFIFSPTQAPKLRGANRAQSLTVNPHKMLGVPATCSFLLVPDTAKFTEANSLEANYLFHSSSDADDNFDLADGTLGCGRRADSVKFYLSWQWYGTEGYKRRIDHAYEVTQYLAAKIKADPRFYLLVEPECLQTCFFFIPNGKLGTKEENTRLTRAIASQLHKDGKFLVDYALHPEKGEFFRIVVNSPSVDKSLMDKLLNDVIDAYSIVQPSLAA